MTNILSQYFVALEELEKLYEFKKTQPFHSVIELEILEDEIYDLKFAISLMLKKENGLCGFRPRGNGFNDVVMACLNHVERLR